MDAPALSLSLFPYRLRFRASETIDFPAAGASNIVRGALGIVLRKACGEEPAYSRLFAPVKIGGASGFADPPRPFVLRAAVLNGRRIERGESFHFDLHLFEHNKRRYPNSRWPSAGSRRRVLVPIAPALRCNPSNCSIRLAGRHRRFLRTIESRPVVQAPSCCRSRARARQFREYKSRLPRRRN